MLFFSLLALEFFSRAYSDASLSSSEHFGRNFFRYSLPSGSLKLVVESLNEDGAMYTYFESQGNWTVTRWSTGLWDSWVQPVEGPFLQLPYMNRGSVLRYKNRQYPERSGYYLVTNVGPTEYMVYPMISPVEVGIGGRRFEMEGDPSRVFSSTTTLSLPDGTQVAGFVYNARASGSTRRVCYVLFREFTNVLEETVEDRVIGVLEFMDYPGPNKSCVSVAFESIEEGGSVLLALVSYQPDLDYYSEDSTSMYTRVSVEVDPDTQELTMTQLDEWSRFYATDASWDTTTFTIERVNNDLIILGTVLSVESRLEAPIMEGQGWRGHTTSARRVTEIIQNNGYLKIRQEPVLPVGRRTTQIDLGLVQLVPIPRGSGSYTVAKSESISLPRVVPRSSTAEIRYVLNASTIFGTYPTVDTPGMAHYDTYRIVLGNSAYPGRELIITVTQDEVLFDRSSTWVSFPRDVELPPIVPISIPERLSNHTNVQILVDTTVVEVFVNNGLLVGSFEYYLVPPSPENALLTSIVYPDSITFQATSNEPESILDRTPNPTISLLAESYKSLGGMRVVAEDDGLIREEIPSFTTPAPVLRNTPSNARSSFSFLAIFVIFFYQFIHVV